ncbi:hypothetical protein JW859_10835 [bacterium]|nr:hypothetical protein [bacterium]
MRRLFATQKNADFWYAPITSTFQGKSLGAMFFCGYICFYSAFVHDDPGMANDFNLLFHLINLLVVAGSIWKNEIVIEYWKRQRTMLFIAIPVWLGMLLFHAWVIYTMLPLVSNASMSYPFSGLAGFFLYIPALAYLLLYTIVKQGFDFEQGRLESMIKPAPTERLQGGVR